MASQRLNHNIKISPKGRAYIETETLVRRRLARLKQKESATDTRQADGYWIRMGALAVDALTECLRADLTPRRKEIIAEYLGGVMDDAYNMGIRLGELKATLPTELQGVK